MKLEHRVSESEDGQRLDAVLALVLPQALGRPLSRSSIRRIVMAGAVRLAGRPLRRPGQPLRGGQRISLDLRPGAIPAVEVRGDRPAAMGGHLVLFEDEVLIAVDKPPGLPTQPTVDQRRPSLYSMVKDWLLGRQPGFEPYLGLHQRLDRDTSGVVVFTKERSANPAMAAAFAGRTVRKTYHALTARPAELPPRRFSVDVPVAGAVARTEFRLLKVGKRGLLVEACPLTGRKHQIRLHLAARGMPILGDGLHGGKAVGGRAPRLMLHAVRLSFRHPVSGSETVIESGRPPDFAQVLAAL